MQRVEVGATVLVWSTDWEGPRPGLVTKVWNETMVNVTALGDGSYDNWEVRQFTSLSHKGDGFTPSWTFFGEIEVATPGKN